MIVQANGKPLEISEGASLAELINLLGLGARWVVAEVNGEAVDRKDMASLELHHGDSVELVRAVAGG
jgi:thiamine biosynthesis protein ThiS